MEIQIVGETAKRIDRSGTKMRPKVTEAAGWLSFISASGIGAACNVLEAAQRRVRRASREGSQFECHFELELDLQLD